MRTQFGIPDSLPPLNLRDVWGRLWLGLTGLLLLVLSLFPNLVPPPWGSALVLVCWLVLPVRGLMNQSARKSRTDAQKRMSNQVSLYTLIVVGFGIGFTLWARHLGLPWPVVIGVLFMMEALPSAIVSLTEWWRLSTVGFSTGLMICGFGFPLVNENRMFVLVGGSVFLGSLLSAGILYWQVRNNESSPALSRSSKETD
jgi:hypothetical protein